MLHYLKPQQNCTVHLCITLWCNTEATWGTTQHINMMKFLLGMLFPTNWSFILCKIIRSRYTVKFNLEMKPSKVVSVLFFSRKTFHSCSASLHPCEYICKWVLANLMLWGIVDSSLSMKTVTQMKKLLILPFEMHKAYNFHPTFILLLDHPEQN